MIRKTLTILTATVAGLSLAGLTACGSIDGSVDPQTRMLVAQNLANNIRSMTTIQPPNMISSWQPIPSAIPAAPVYPTIQLQPNVYPANPVFPPVQTEITWLMESSNRATHRNQKR